MILTILISFSLATFTTISMSAIASNGQIEIGGAYYMISRELGLEIGGAIGILFYIANVVGGAFNLVGISLQIVDLV